MIPNHFIFYLSFYKRILLFCFFYYFFINLNKLDDKAFKKFIDWVNYLLTYNVINLLTLMMDHVNLHSLDNRDLLYFFFIVFLVLFNADEL